MASDNREPQETRERTMKLDLSRDVQEAIREMLKNWNATEFAIRKACPNATAEQLQKMTAAAMSKSLGL